MARLSRWLIIFGFKRGEVDGGIPLINPAIPRKQLWTFIAVYAVIGVILAILHHTVAPWL
jgi:hypothetical protein